MNPIKVQYNYSRDDLMHATEGLGRILTPRSKVPQWIGGILMVGSLFALISPHFAVKTMLPPFLLGAGFVLVPRLIPKYLRRLMVFIMWRKSAGANKLASWIISEDEFNWEMDGVKYSFGWSKIVKAREQEDGILLFTTPILAHWLPKRGFASEDQVEELRVLIRKKSIDYQSIF